MELSDISSDEKFLNDELHVSDISSNEDFLNEDVEHLSDISSNEDFLNEEWDVVNDDQLGMVSFIYKFLLLFINCTLYLIL